MTGETGATRRTATVTVLFCDLVSSTERQSRLGDDANDEFRRRFFAVSRDVVVAAHGEVVKTIGDAVMAVFRDSAVDAVGCGAAFHRAVETLDVDARIRVGISAGEAAEEEGDWFGIPVVEAARLEAIASPGQTLVTEVVRVLVGSRGGFRFRPIGERLLKGIPAPVQVLALVPDAPTVDADPPKVRPRSRWRVAATIIALVAVLAAAIGVATRGRSKHLDAFQSPLARFKYTPTYARRKCDPALARRIAGLSCGTLTVPQDRARLDRHVVTLEVLRAPARGTAHGDPVIDFGVDDLVTSPARNYAEEISLSARGWPGSVPELTCPAYASVSDDQLSLPLNDRSFTQRASVALRSCYNGWIKRGVDPSAYNLIAEGDDMVDLTRALHLEHVNLVSGYVQTLSALEVMRQLPNGVRTLTLEEPVAPGSSAYSDPTAYLSGALNRYVALCHADAACRVSFPDLVAAVKRDYDFYRTKPRFVEGDDGKGHKHAVLLDGGHIDQALYWALTNRQNYPLIAAAIAAPNGSSVVDQVIANLVAASSLAQGLGWGSVLSTDWCSYSQYTIGDGYRLSSRTLPYLNGVETNGMFAWYCKAWPVRKIADIAFDPPSSTVPTLILNGGLTPYVDQGWVDEFRAGLAHATVATFPTIDGNVLAGNEPSCIGDLRQAFLTDPAKHLDVTECERISPKIRFVASVGS